VRDERQGLPGAQVTLTSSALLGGAASSVTNEKGQLRFQALPPGLYTLDIRMDGVAPSRDEALAVGAGATIERVQDNGPASGSITTANRFDRVTGVSSGGPASFGDFNLERTAARDARRAPGRGSARSHHVEETNRNGQRGASCIRDVGARSWQCWSPVR
jgi:hypothetical protein